jgi:hypothetical protein
MKLDDDCKYLLSLADTLVNKYKEDEKILIRVISILKKFTHLKKTYLNQTKLSLGSYKELSSYIDNLNNTIVQNHSILCDVYNTNTIENKATTINSQSIVSSFESVDIDLMLGKK